MATHKSIGKTASQKPASSRGIKTTTPKPTKTKASRSRTRMIPGISQTAVPQRFSVPRSGLLAMLAIPELKYKRVMIPCDEGELINVYPLEDSAVVIDSHDADRLKSFITEMVPVNLLVDVMQAGLERARKRGLTVEDTCIRPAPLPAVWQKAEDTDEAAEAIGAKVIGVDGEFMASVSFNDSMAPACEKDKEVIFRHGNDPQDGDTVLAYVAIYEQRPQPAFWQLSKLRAWRKGEDPIIFNHLTIRRFGHNENGAITLTPLVDGFPSWTEKICDGKRTEIAVEGVATSYKTTWRERGLHGAVVSVCRPSDAEQNGGAR
jgi:hypothetical protein